MRTIIKYQFSIVSNHRNPIQRTINRRTVTYDSYISRYQDHYITAYTEKRRMKKEEIPPKIHILELEMPQIQNDLNFQLQNSIDIIPLNAMALQYENMEITSAYVSSKFHEKGLKELFQTYSRKVLLNGKMPPMQKINHYNQFLQSITKLYRIFFYGEELSKLQQFIQSQYLNLKLVKHGNYLKSGAKSIKRRNQYLKCIWNDQNQRCLEGYRNWQQRPFDDYADFRPFFNQIFVMKSGNQSTLVDQLILSPKEYLRAENVEFVSIQLFNRILEWCMCLEFNRVLKLPVDFLIELSVVSVHVWMLINRLEKEQSATALCKSLKIKFEMLIRTKLGEISSESGSLFDKEVHQKFLLHWKAFDIHFDSHNPNLRQNITTLIATTVFLSKLQRNTDTIALFSQYIIKNYQLLQRVDVQTILQGNFEFDVYLIPPDYKQTYRVFNSIPSYPFKQQLNQILKPIAKPDLQIQNPSLGTKIYRWMMILTKGLKSYDYYSEVEKQEKQNKQSKQKGWNREENINEEFEVVQKLRSKRKNS